MTDLDWASWTPNQGAWGLRDPNLDLRRGRPIKALGVCETPILICVVDAQSRRLGSETPILICV